MRVARLLPILLIALISLATSPVFDRTGGTGTNVGGVICNDTTWTAAGSPYTVTSSVYVCPGIKLTIQPGVTVKFNDNQAMAIDGTLVADGIIAQPIVFTSSRATPVPGSWAFIKFNDSSQDAIYDGAGNYLTGSILRYATVEYAGSLNPPNGAVWLEKASPFIDHSTIRKNAKTGIFAPQSDGLKITNSTIAENAGVGYAGGIHLGADLSYGTAIITGNSITGNSGGGIFVRYTTVNISGNTISNNNAVDGAGLNLYPGLGTVSSNVITGNVGLGTKYQPSRGGGVFAYGEMAISGNIIYGNQADEAAGVYGANGVTVAGNKIVGNSGNGAPGFKAYYNATFSGNSVVGNVASGWSIETHGSGPITCNTVVGNAASTGGAGVYVYTPPASLANNNIYGNTSYEVYNNSASGVSAANNWWGTTSTPAIDAEIYDFFDNAGKGVVSYTPFLTGAALCAPPAPPTGLTVVSATAAEGALKLSWSASPEADVAGYRVYWDTDSGFPYANSIDVGKVTGHTLTGLIAGTTYYVAVTAYEDGSDGNGADESWFSQEVTGVAVPALIASMDCAPDLFNPATGGSTSCGFTLGRTAWAVLLVLDSSYNLKWVSPFDPAGSQYGPGSHEIDWAGQLMALADGPYIPILYAVDTDGKSGFGLGPAIFVRADNGQAPVVSNLTLSPVEGGPYAVGPQNIAFDVDKYHLPLMGVLNGELEWVRVLADEKAYAGHESFQWDGKDSGGNDLPPGAYWYLGIAIDEDGRIGACYTDGPGGEVGCFTMTARREGERALATLAGDVPALIRQALPGLLERVGIR